MSVLRVSNAVPAQPAIAEGASHQGRGELRDKPRRDLRVATGAKGLFLPAPVHPAVVG